MTRVAWTMRWVPGLAVAVLLAVASLGFASPAHAHGGAFREDGGVPPPVPGAPRGRLPNSKPTTPGVPNGPQPKPKSNGPSTAGFGGGVPRTRARLMKEYSPMAWRHWWVLHRDELLPPAGASTRRDPVTGRKEAPRPGTLDESEWAIERRMAHRIVGTVIEPLLARLAQRDDLRPQELAAALIAWARCASHPPDMKYFVERALSRKQSLEVRESAVLALGLLRRSNPHRRFPVGYVDAVRHFLEDVTADDKLPRSVRVFAVLSLGLLGDQPFQPETPADAQRTTQVLWRHVRNVRAHYALQHAALVAIGMQPRVSVPDEVSEVLSSVARGRHPLNRRWHETTRANALASLARMNHVDWRTIAKGALRSRRAQDVVKFTAISLLGRAAARMPTWEREDLGKTLRKAVNLRSTPLRVRGELLIALGRVFSAAAADPQATPEELLRNRTVLDHHLKKARLHIRPFAAIGLGLAVRDMDAEALDRHELARDIRRRLVREMPLARGSDEAVAAYALACGLAQADEAAPWLMEQLDDTNAMSVMRAHCALSLGLLGRGYKPIRDSLRKAALDRKSPAIHLYAVRALTMLGQKNVPAMLERHLRDVRSPSAQRTLVLGLARTARPETFAPLLERVANPDVPPMTSVMAIAALGVMADPEPRPSRTRLVPSVNRYLLSPDMLNFLNVL